MNFEQYNIWQFSCQQNTINNNTDGSQCYEVLHIIIEQNHKNIKVGEDA